MNKFFWDARDSGGLKIKQDSDNKSKIGALALRPPPMVRYNHALKAMGKVKGRPATKKCLVMCNKKN